MYKTKEFLIIAILLNIMSTTMPNQLFAEDKNKQLKNDLTDCKPLVSLELENQINREVEKLVGIKQGRSIITDTSNFSFDVYGLTKQGDEVDLTTYMSGSKKGEIWRIDSVKNTTPGEPLYGVDKDGKSYTTKKAERHRKEFQEGSTVILNDGRVLSFKNGHWNQCK